MNDDTYEKEILVTIASYIDPLLMQTLMSAMGNADNPYRIRFAIVDQNEYTLRYELEKLSFINQIAYVFMPITDSRGVCFARALTQSLLGTEDYVLQIDSHTIFDKGWDTSLIMQYDELASDGSSPILTAYPHVFKMENGLAVKSPHEDGKTLTFMVDDSTTITEDDMTLKFTPVYTDTDKALKSIHIAGGFIFSSRQFILDIPYDPYMYFSGEEQSLALRAYTHGYDLYNPHNIPLYHLYKKANVSHMEHHWNEVHESKRTIKWTTLNSISLSRLKMLITGDCRLGIAYRLGSIRTISEFAKDTGIDYTNRTITRPIP